MKTIVSAFLVVACMSVGTLYAQERGTLGVTMSDNSVGGVLITHVIANSPAARIGLRSGDRILSVNDQPIANYRDVTRIIRRSQPNTPVTLEVARGRWRGKLTAQLGAATSVFNPARQYTDSVQHNPVQPFTPASRPMYFNYPSYSGWGGFPREWIDNGNRGVAASYGGGGW